MYHRKIGVKGWVTVIKRAELERMNLRYNKMQGLADMTRPK